MNRADAITLEGWEIDMRADFDHCWRIRQVIRHFDNKAVHERLNMLVSPDESVEDLDRHIRPVEQQWQQSPYASQWRHFAAAVGESRRDPAASDRLLDQVADARVHGVDIGMTEVEHRSWCGAQGYVQAEIELDQLAAATEQARAGRVMQA